MKNLFKNIIVRMPNWIGDLVMATPILEDLKKTYPQAKVTAMALETCSDLLLNNPHIDEIFAFRRPSGWLHRDETRHILNPLRHGGYDLGVLLTNSFSSAWWFWRGRVHNRLGFKGNARNFLLDIAVPFPKDLEEKHLVNVYKDLIVPLGIESSSTPPRLFVSKEEVAEAKNLLRILKIPPDATIIGVNPCAAFASAKCWLPERYAEVTKKFLEDPKTYILYFGSADNAPHIHSICHNLPGRVFDLSGKTSIRELMALIEMCNAFLTNDGGPMHIASALGTPLVALFGSTNDIRTGPYSGGTVIHKRPSCSPCYKDICPIDFRCMKQIEVDEVASEVRKLLPPIT